MRPLPVTPSPELRLRRVTVLLAGAGVLAAAVRPGALPFVWTPLVLGAVYLAVALLGGRGDGYWSAALVVACWGATVVAVSELDLAVRAPAAYMVAVGGAALLAAALQRRGFAVDLRGVGLAIVVAGLFFGLDRYWVDLLGKGRTYAVLLVAWAGLEAAQAARARRAALAAAPG